jgi:nicotinate-nucleotide--dimethylbenzimidazole phosphoribosyltransferase
VNYDFPLNTNLISAKNWDGNTVFLHGPAMSAMELQLCLNKGRSRENDCKTGCNCIGFGEMGIGNTATASVLMSIILALPIADCVGKERVSQTLIEKINILKKCLDNYEGENNLESKLAYWRI